MSIKFVVHGNLKWGIYMKKTLRVLINNVNAKGTFRAHKYFIMII